MTEMAAGEPESTKQPRLWLVTLVVAAVSMLLGVAVGGGTLYLTGWRYQPDRAFSVIVFLKEGTTAEQKAAIQATLEKMPSRNGVHLETKAEAYAHYKELFKGETLSEYITPDTLPESFRLSIVAKEFDCKPVFELRKLPGIGQIIVGTAVTKKHPGGSVVC